MEVEGRTGRRAGDIADGSEELRAGRQRRRGRRQRIAGGGGGHGGLGLLIFGGKGGAEVEETELGARPELSRAGGSGSVRVCRVSVWCRFFAYGF